MNSTHSINRREISAQVTILLTLYWTAAEPPEVRQAQLRMWLEDLDEFPHELVAKACREYRQGENHRHRPLPGDIRHLCIRLQEDRRERLALTRREPWPKWLEDLRGAPPDGPRKRAEAIARDKAKMGPPVTAEGGRAISRKWAQDRGFDSLDAYAAAHGMTYEDACVEVCQSFLKGSPIAGVIKDTAAKARGEYRPTPEQLKAGRRELGLEDADSV